MLQAGARVIRDLGISSFNYPRTGNVIVLWLFSCILWLKYTYYRFRYSWVDILQECKYSNNKFLGLMLRQKACITVQNTTTQNLMAVVD